jgi:hypothetical protein
LIDKTPTPVFTRLQRFHNRVFGVVKVFGGMFVFGRITTANMAAFHAQAQMDPGVARFQAFLTTLWRMRLDVVNMIEMGAGVHLSILQLLIEDKAVQT